MRFRRSAHVALGSALFLGSALLTAPSASAANLGTVTITGASAPYSFSPATINGNVGDTFTVVDASTGGATMSVSYSYGYTGEVSVGSQPCTVGQATCIASSGGGTTYTITQLGTIAITSQPGGTVGQLTLQSGSSATDLRNVYTTMTFDPNGGTCTGPLQFTDSPGSSNDRVRLPSYCSRQGYFLWAWENRHSSVAGFDPGSQLLPGWTIPIGKESTTLYAYWIPEGDEVTYDANVGMDTECVSGGVNVTSPAARSTTSVVPSKSPTATAAPCTPVNGKLSGWAYTGDGPVKVKPGELLPLGSLRWDRRITLYAKWTTDYGLTATIGAALTSEHGTSRKVTLKATVNGAPAGPGLPISVLAGGRPSSLTTDNLGRATLTVNHVDTKGYTFLAAFGDKQISVPVEDARSASGVVNSEENDSRR